MSKENNVLLSNVFSPNTVKIEVLNDEHNGNVWKHSHSFFEFVYVDQGFSLHSFNGRTSVLTAGDIFAIPPGYIHSYNNAYHTKIYNCLFVLEELGSLADEVLELSAIKWVMEESKVRLPLIKAGLTELRELVLLLEKMKWERANKCIGWQLNLKSLLISYLIFLSRLIINQAASYTEKSEYFGYIYKALHYIDENYKEDISTSDIATNAGLSADYLAKHFKTVMAMSPSEYIRKFRIAKAMELLKTTTLSVADVSTMVGINDTSSFSRIFKQIMQVSPIAFRKGNDEE